MLNQLTKNGITDSLQNSCREGRRRAIWDHLLQTVPGASTIFLHHQPLHSCHVTDVPELYGLPPVSGLQGNGWDNQFHVCWSSPSTCRSCQRPWLKPPNRILYIVHHRQNRTFDLFRFSSKKNLSFCRERFHSAAQEVNWKTTLKYASNKCVQDPQMSLGFAASGQSFDKELYKFYEKKGGVVHLTVWPVVYLHEGGPIISKGYVLPK